MSSDIRLTEERLRNHLDTNQVMRERMCLALLPLLGPYTREQPRRPKGGPDGGRDLEAVFQGTIPIWGAVGFRNGGGRDTEARDWTEKKFKDDVDSSLKENPTLPGFIFFTNVDITPGGKETLIKYAQARNVAVVDIFDMERLRHALDTPEGLLVRLQYLDIPMSASEQAALVGKYGNQLQNAVTARFDRVERTLAQMESFLDLQKPLFRLDCYVHFSQIPVSAALGDEAILVILHGVHDINKRVYLLLTNELTYPQSAAQHIMSGKFWISDKRDHILDIGPTVAFIPMCLMICGQLSITSGGRRTSLTDLSAIGIEVICTEGYRNLIRSIAIDSNGYQLFHRPADGQGEPGTIEWASSLVSSQTGRKWVNLVMRTNRDLLFDPLKKSPRVFFSMLPPRS